MKWVLLQIGLSVSILGCSQSVSSVNCVQGGSLNYALYQRVLDRFVSGGMVRYERLKANDSDLNDFVSSLRCVGPDTTPEFFPTEADKIAFWINAYNAVSMRDAAKMYPCDSVQSFFSDFETSHKVAIDGRILTLRALADLARKAGKDDPRIELALIFPAKGSGKLSGEVYLAKKLDKQLEKAIGDAIDNPKLVHIDHENWALKLGKSIWIRKEQYVENYDKTFETQGSMLNALLSHANSSQRRKLETAIGYNLRMIPFDYDLNDSPEQRCLLDN